MKFSVKFLDAGFGAAVVLQAVIKGEKDEEFPTKKKAVFTFKTFLLPALLKGTLNNLFPSDFLWALLLGELPLR